MRGRTVLLLAICIAALVASARATQDFCVIVRNTPDGFLALRDGPGAQFRVKAKRQPGELLVADTRGGAQSQWTFINSVPRLDGRLEKAKRFTQGWVASKFTSQAARCPGEE
jgi:hypothetical protein